MAEPPRRIRLDSLSPAERAIVEAVQLVEAMGADVRLTDAVVLLQAARESVADFIENIGPVRRRVWSGLMAGFAPAETDRSTTNSGDTGGPSELKP